jgi:hypothetical protein
MDMLRNVELSCWSVSDPYSGIAGLSAPTAGQACRCSIGKLLVREEIQRRGVYDA